MSVLLLLSCSGTKLFNFPFNLAYWISSTTLGFIIMLDGSNDMRCKKSKLVNLLKAT